MYGYCASCYRSANSSFPDVESGSLAQIIENFDVFPETLTALYMYQCLRGLVYLHENNVPHGSIKGSNILITKNGQVKLYGTTYPSSLPYG